MNSTLEILVLLITGGLISRGIEWVICMLRASRCITDQQVEDLEQRVHRDLDGDGVVGRPSTTI